MRHIKFVVPILFLASAQAFADWADPGAAYLCDRGRHVFSVVSVMDTSSPEDPGTVIAPAGYTTLSESRSVQCTINGKKVSAVFNVRSPQETGMCGGITQTSLMSLRVNGMRVFELPVLFNHYCIENQALHSIEIKPEGSGARVKICHADWDWGVGYHNVQCESHRL